MATDLNKSLNLDTFITNLDEVIKKICVLNTDLSNLTKTSENAAKATEELNKAEKDSNEIIEQTNEKNKELEKLKQQNLKTLDKLNVAWSNENKELIASRIALQEENKAVKEHVKEMRNRLKGTDDLNKALETQATTINEATAQNKALRAAVRDVDLTTEEGIKKIDEYNKKIEQNDRIITNSSDAFVKQKRNIGAYHTALNGIRQGFDNATLGAKAFLANPIGAIMQSLVFLFKEFNTALNSSEEGQLALAKATGIFKGVMQAIQNLIFSIAKPLISLFEDPRQAIENIKTDIQEKIFRVFDNLRTISTSLGKILKGVFTLDKNMIAEGAAEATEAAKDLYKETSITYALIEKGKEFYEDVVDVAGQASEIELDRRKQQVERNKLIVEEATLQRDIANAKREANDADNDARTQLEAINKAYELTQKLNSKRLADKKEELRLLGEQGGLGENAIEDNEEYARLQAEILKLEEQEANQLRVIEKRRATILTSIEKEGEALEKLEKFKTEAFDASQVRLKTTQDQDEEERDKEKQDAQSEIELASVVNDAKKGFEDDYYKLSANLAEAAFNEKKQDAIKAAYINTREGITKALSGGVKGLILAPIIAAKGALEIASIAGVSRYYTGTDNAKKGLAFVSERGAEIVEDKKGNMRLIPDMSLINLEGGEKVYTTQETKQIMFDDSRIIKELRRQKQTVIVNINKESYARKYAFKT